MLYMVTFTINIPTMLAYIPYMDPMGKGVNCWCGKAIGEATMIYKCSIFRIYVYKCLYTGGEQFAMAKHPLFEGKSSNKMGHGFHSYVRLDALVGRVRLWFISGMRLLNAVDLESWVKLVPPIGQCHWKTSSEKSLVPLVYIHH